MHMSGAALQFIQKSHHFFFLFPILVGVYGFRFHTSQFFLDKRVVSVDSEIVLSCTVCDVQCISNLHNGKPSFVKTSPDGNGRNLNSNNFLKWNLSNFSKVCLKMTPLQYRSDSDKYVYMCDRKENTYNTPNCLDSLRLLIQ